MLEKLKQTLKSFAYKKYQRIEDYIKNLENTTEIKNKIDQKHISEINYLIKDRIKRLKKLYLFNFIFYIGIYFSFVSFIFQSTTIISKITNFLNVIISFFGTSVFILGIFLINKLKEIYYQDLNLLSSHLISIYNSQNKTSKKLFPKSNHYKSFISFFKRKGF